MRSVHLDFQTPLLTKSELHELRFYVREFAMSYALAGELKGLTSGLRERLAKDFGEGYEVELMDGEEHPCNDDEFHSDILILQITNKPVIH